MKKLNVLCFHGARQDAEFFRSKVEKLNHSLIHQHGIEVGFTYLDGAWQMPLEEGDTVQMRCWYEPYILTAEEKASRVTVQVKHEGNNTSTIGFKTDPTQSLEHIETTATAKMAEMEDSTTGFDVFLGSSQGCPIIVDLLRKRPEVVQRIAPNLRGLLLYGSPSLAEGASSDIKIKIPSVHFMGEADTIVPLQDSLTMAQDNFVDPIIRQHPHGHIVPSNAKDIEVVKNFLETIQEPIDDEQAAQELAEEIEQVMMVFGGDGVELDDVVTRHPRGSRYSATVKLALVEEPCVVHLSIECPPSYPQQPPSLKLHGMPEDMPARRMWEAATQLELVELSDSLKGAPMMLQLFMAAKDAVEMKFDKIAAGEGEESADGTTEPLDPWAEELDTPETREVLVRQAETKAIEIAEKLKKNGSSKHGVWSSRKGGGDWKYIIGLVGKPSAGKSTFFNSVTNPDSEAEAAKVGAFPFTTIEPNYGTAFVGVPCPCSNFRHPNTEKEIACKAEFGHMPQLPGEPKRRRMPIVVKDVAGLVKGAYQGRGKGNRFLNDLVDADVLVHVVDGAGATSREGDTATEGDESTKGNPLEDVEWVRDEVHHWIFDNVRAKWSAIQHNPSKLLGMFSGYHARSELVEEALHRCGVDIAKGGVRELNAKIPTWTPEQLHLLIAVFITMRFPIVLATNKLDLEGTAANVTKLRERYPFYPIAPMSANVECTLLKLREAGHVKYIAGSTEVESTLDDSSTAVDSKVKAAIDRCEAYFKKQAANASEHAVKSTGVVEVLRLAASLRAATVVFPVEDLVSLEGTKHKETTVLHRCVMLKPGSTVEDVFDILARDGTVAGKFVRCEGIVLADAVFDTDTSCGDVGSQQVLPKPVILRRDEPPGHGTIIKVMTNRLRHAKEQSKQ